MPRRNRNPRAPKRPLLDPEASVPERPPRTTDEMARRLVIDGKASPLILGPLLHPWASQANR